MIWEFIKGSAIARIGLVCLAAVGAYKGIQYSGVTKERARVEEKGKRVDAKAQSSRRAAESNPASVLSRYYRD